MSVAKTGKQKTGKLEVGWREWVALPDLGISMMKAKLDTGARSSALHAFGITIQRKHGVETVRFGVHPLQRSTKGTVFAEATLLDRRMVRSSSGHAKYRPVIVTELVLMGLTQQIELTLVNRSDMGFRMLLGRQALRARFLVDPEKSYANGRPARKKRARKRKAES